MCTLSMYAVAVIPPRSARYGTLTWKIAASAPRVQAWSDASADAIVESGGTFENPIRNVRVRSAPLGSAVRLPQASGTEGTSARSASRPARGHCKRYVGTLADAVK